MKRFGRAILFGRFRSSV